MQVIDAADRPVVDGHHQIAAAQACAGGGTARIAADHFDCLLPVELVKSGQAPVQRSFPTANAKKGPANTARWVLSQLLTHGRVRRAFLGIGGREKLIVD